ncbi:hypothetical protein PHLGIDRAFT_12520 [Phlebiopsis gigantea 11061_1 CR5-6]|uniref:Uncharacterized protein n=1 Tax=Phlebiopsis gigantea (strain 11061_1 CR5-6) TaxID=745531 RepID=A0A0C3NTM6_PHLG1|nr:hypothetical protein PHLGIDRAFT_12520 [Phlebiopsis gigantea 11061_1 CR5-6]
MQLSLSFLALSAFVASAAANPVASSRAGFSLAGRSEDGAYTFDRHGNITSFVTADTLRRRMEARGLPSIVEREDATELASRASTGTNCFKAKFSGGDKLNAVNAMFALLDDYNVVAASGAIATQFGSGLVYVCNFDTVSSQTANANDVHPQDNVINNACGSNTAGRDRFAKPPRSLLPYFYTVYREKEGFRGLDIKLRTTRMIQI